MNNKAVKTINNIAIAMKFEISLAGFERSMALRWLFINQRGDIVKKKRMVETKLDIRNSKPER